MGVGQEKHLLTPVFSRCPYFVPFAQTFSMATFSQPNSFIDASGVDQLILDFKDELKKENRVLQVSDVTDDNGNQYVDLVQEGGGVLGIALVGYTYVLEKMGIRFFSMAGTSAGSINAMLLACCGKREEEKSPVIVHHLAQLDMFSFVDGKPGNNRFTRWIKKTVQQFILGTGAMRRLLRLLVILMGGLLVTSLACFVINFFRPGIARWLGLGAGVLLLVLATLLLFAINRFKQFARNGYGLNCGQAFHDWIKSAINQCAVNNDPACGNITDLASFSRHFMRVPALQVKPDPRRENNLPPHMPMLTIITCDILAGVKVEFPRMWDLYWKNQEDVHPGDFVRASMSIPVFFESYAQTGLRSKSSFDIWSRHLNWQNALSRIPDNSQFIDGGVLSNFPISIFYNPRYPVPRMPTFGIRLQDGVLDSASRSNNNLYKYIFSLFSTIRFNFDRDFIAKNRAFNKAVCSIDVRAHSWLNFFMKDGEKLALFRKGAEAAIAFLRGFNWEEYKTARWENFHQAAEDFENPNNLQEFPFSTISAATQKPV